MKIIAFFDLKEETDIKKYYAWVKARQAKVFGEKLPQMKNFRVYELTEADNFPNLRKIVQVFDWDGSADDWRETLKSFRDPANEAVFKIAAEWLEICDDESTQILYAEYID